MRRPRAWLRLPALLPRFRAMIVAGVALLAACQDAGPSRPERSVAGPEGTILGTGQPLGLGLSIYELPALGGQDFKLPPAQYGGQVFWGAHLEADGQALAFVGLHGNTSRLFRLSVKDAPEPIGPPMRYVSGFQVRDDLVMATTCSGRGQVWLLNLASPARWRRVGQSCVAALSPDGEGMAIVRNRSEVWEQRMNGGPPRRIVDVAQIAGLRYLGIRRFDVTALTWGDGGLAVLIGPGGFDPSARSAVLVVQGGKEMVVPLAPQSIYLPRSAWQPGGDLLALITRPSSGGALVRLFDPRTGELRVAAADAQFFGDLAWSPDGQTLVVNTSTNAWLFFDTEGNWIRRAGAVGAAPYEWAA